MLQSTIAKYFILIIHYLTLKCQAKIFKLQVLEREPVCDVEDRFLSVAVSMSNAKNGFKNIDSTSQKLKMLLTALKPAYLRLGGGASNFLFFKVGSTKPSTPPIFPNQQGNVAPTQQPIVTSLPSTSIPSSGNIGSSNAKPTSGSSSQNKPSNDAPFTPVIPGDSPTPVPSNGGMQGQGSNGQPMQPQGQNQPPNLNQNGPQSQGSNQGNQNQPPNIGPTSKPNKQPYTGIKASEPSINQPHYVTVQGNDPPNPGDALNEYQNSGPENELEAKNHIQDGSGKELDESGEGLQSSGDEDASGKEYASGDNGDAEVRAAKSIVAEKRYLIKAGKMKQPFWLMSDDFDRFYNFVQDAGLDLIFNLGDFVRYDNGSWNATNALEMFHHVAYRGFKVGWQLGNEPNRYKKYGQDKIINATQAGTDTVELRRILRSNSNFGTLLVGPDVTRLKPRGSAERYLREYLKTNASSEVSAVSWHQYYVNGNKVNEEGMVDPDTLDLFKDQVQRIRAVLKETNTNKSLWLTETGSAWAGGASGLSGTYAASFMYLDKLGLAGVFCNSVVARQSLLKGSNAMLDGDYTPRPDYWLALLHKRLIGKRVLLVSGDNKKLRAYAHCTRHSSSYPPGAVTVFVLNIAKVPVRVAFKKEFKGRKIDQFLVTSGDGSLTTKTVMLNGEKLQMRSNTTLPNLSALSVEQPMKIPSYSYAFYVIPDAGLEHCK